MSTSPEAKKRANRNYYVKHAQELKKKEKARYWKRKLSYASPSST